MSYRNIQTEKIILPEQTIGVLGGGQLGRMIALAGKAMGYRFVTLDPGVNCPCAQIADRHIIAKYNDATAAEQLANESDVITYEFENVDAQVVENLEKLSYVPQGSTLLRITQNRILEKKALQSFSLPVAPFEIIYSESGQSISNQVQEIKADDGNVCGLSRQEVLKTAVTKLGMPVIMKTATGGYDGKGQWIIKNDADLLVALQVFDQPEYIDIDFIVEKFVEFDCEISVIIARNGQGEVEVFPVAENKHINNILHTSIVPARISENALQQARLIAIDIAENLKLVGVLAVEMFYQANNGRIFINELAPRPHNSGHFTMDACETSQFEQHVRAICNLPLGNTTLHKPVVMINLLGQHMDDFIQAIPNLPPEVKFHLYGKEGRTHNRKMGHVNIVADSIKQALEIIDTHLSFCSN